MTRPVILHFHLFKNAGTSVDAALKQNFDQGWAQIESQDLRQLGSDSLVEFVRANPHIKAISTHTAAVKIPVQADLKFIPICFVRHPIDRIRSAYDFEKQQTAPTPSALQAKKGTFRDYMNWYLASPPARQVSDFHAFHFKDFHVVTPETNRELVEMHAVKAVHDMPWLGLVEQFDKSLEMFVQRIKQDFPGFNRVHVRANRTTKSDAKLQDSLTDFRSRIGEATYRELQELNAIDFQLYEIVKQRFSDDVLK